MDLLKKYLLRTAMRFAPNDPPGGGGGNDQNQGGDGGDDISFDENDVGDDQGDDQGGDDQGDDQDDDDPDDDQGDDQGGEGDPPPQSRGNRQFADLRRTSRETARQNAELTRRLAEMEGTVASLRQQQVSPQETPQQRAERYALLSPEERAQEMVNEALARNRAETQQINAQLMDQADRSTFEARCASNPLFRKLQNDVERELQGLRQRGERPLPREVIATYLIGQRVVAQQAGRSNGNRQTRRQQQRTRPLNPGSNAGGQRQQQRRGAPQTAEDYEAQFGDVSI